MLIVAAFALTACAVSAPARLNISQADSALTSACAAAVEIPDRAMAQHEVENGWAADRASLRNCSWKHSSVVKYYTSRDKALMKK